MPALTLPHAYMHHSSHVYPKVVTLHRPGHCQVCGLSMMYVVASNRAVALNTHTDVHHYMPNLHAVILPHKVE